MGSWIRSSYHRYRRRRHGMIPPLIVPPPNHGATMEDNKILQILNGRITDTLIMQFIVPPLALEGPLVVYSDCLAVCNWSINGTLDTVNFGLGAGQGVPWRKHVIATVRLFLGLITCQGTGMYRRPILYLDIRRAVGVGGDQLLGSLVT